MIKEAQSRGLGQLLEHAEEVCRLAHALLPDKRNQSHKCGRHFRWAAGAIPSTIHHLTRLSLRQIQHVEHPSKLARDTVDEVTDMASEAVLQQRLEVEHLLPQA